MFDIIKKKKELIIRELEVYRKEKLAEITLDVAKAQELGATQERDYECEWHNRKEKREVEIGIFEERKKLIESQLKDIERFKEDEIKSLKDIIKERDNVIGYQEKTIDKLLSKIPSIDLKDLNINLKK